MSAPGSGGRVGTRGPWAASVASRQRRRIAATVACDRPSSRAMARLAPLPPGASRARVTTSASSTVAGRPVRGRCSRPARPALCQRCRQVPTVCRETPRRRAIWASRSPSSASSTTRARTASGPPPRAHSSSTSSASSAPRATASPTTRHRASRNRPPEPAPFTRCHAGTPDGGDRRCRTPARAGRPAPPDRTLRAEHRRGERKPAPRCCGTPGPTGARRVTGDAGPAPPTRRHGPPHDADRRCRSHLRRTSQAAVPCEGLPGRPGGGPGRAAGRGRARVAGDATHRGGPSG